MPYPRFQRARAFMYYERTAASIDVSSTTWLAVSTAMDITLDAAPQDVIEAGVSGLWGSEVNSGYLDVVTFHTNAIRSSFGAPHTATSPGIPAWRGVSGVLSSVGGSLMRALNGSDVSNGFVTLRLLARADAATPTKTLFATSDIPLQFWARNLGPMDPSRIV